jgi:hypothetical protein
MHVALRSTCQQIITPPLVAVGALASAVLAVIGTVYLFTQADDSRLTSKQQVTTGEATAVGQEEGAYQLKFVINPSRAADPKVRVAFLELKIVI